MVNLKSQKKGNGWIVTLLIILIVAVFALFGYLLFGNSMSTTGKSETYVASDLEISSVTSNLGSFQDINDRDYVLLTSSDLSSTSKALTIGFDISDDSFNTEDMKYAIKVTNLMGYDSHDSSIDDKQYLVSYDENSKDYNVTISVDGKSASTGDLTHTFLLEGTSSAEVTFDIADTTTANNILEVIGLSKTFAKIQVIDSKGSVLDSFEVQFSKTN